MARASGLRTFTAANRSATLESIMKLQVECCSGHKAAERPVKFWLGDSVLFVEPVEDQWYGPAVVYFRVRSDDGNTYVLRHNEQTNEWTRVSFRSPASPGQFDPHFDPPDSIQ